MCRLGKTAGSELQPDQNGGSLFNRKSNHTPPERTITMNGKDIPYSTECRYLGLTLDERLKWMLHFSKKMQIAKGLLFKTKNALGITWGLKPHLLRWVYTGIVRPAISYGSLAWSHAVRYKYQLNQLRKVHGLVLRMLGPKRKGTPIAGLEMAAYLPPLDLYLKGESIKAYMRNKTALEIGWDGLNKQRQTVGHLHLIKKAAEAMGVPDSEWDRGPAHLHFDNNFTVEVESPLIRAKTFARLGPYCATQMALNRRKTTRSALAVGSSFRKPTRMGIAKSFVRVATICRNTTLCTKRRSRPSKRLLNTSIDWMKGNTKR
jgi:hypothetical protein